MEKPIYKLKVFDGPLELLLHLISKNKVSIYDIPIALILEQYMQYIDHMKSMDLEISSEFIEMAANLMYIKSRMLLPKSEPDEPDPREQLALRLAEYKRYKQVLDPLRKREQGAGIRYVRPAAVIEFDKKHTRVYELSKLISAYRQVVKRDRAKSIAPINSFKGIVGRQIASVSVKIITVLRMLKKGNVKSFYSLFSKSRSRSDIVATFLAVLELSKSRRIRIDNSGKDVTVRLNSDRGDN